MCVLGGLGLTQPVADVSEKFMQSLKASDYDTAFGLLHPDLQKKIGNAPGLKKMVEGGNAKPVKWTFTSRNIENGTGTMEGSVTMTGGEGTVSLELVQVGNAWKITSFDLSEN